MKLTYILFFALMICSLTNCKQVNIEKVSKEDLYVISKEDSINKTSQNSNKIPPPRIPQEYNWYSDLVFILDSKDKVYIYQTERKFANESAHYNYPNYIGLLPRYLVTIDSDNFVKFLKDNNDKFGIFPNENHVHTSFFFASQSDTIKNSALFDLSKELNKTKSRTIYIVRKTTEEENIVLQYKQNGLPYNPEDIKWSMKFYNGQVTPFTKEYYDFETKIHSQVIAIETFKSKEMMLEM